MLLAFVIFHRHEFSVWRALFSCTLFIIKLLPFFYPVLFRVTELIFPLQLLQYRMEMIALHAVFRFNFEEWKWDSHVIEIFVITANGKDEKKSQLFHTFPFSCIFMCNECAVDWMQLFAFGLICATEANYVQPFLFVLQCKSVFYVKYTSI